MSSDPGIICFRHCGPGSIFCKKIQEICPVCQLRITSYSVEPFTIPYPYKNAVHEPNTIVIRLTQGSFLKDYEIKSYLHVGVVNSKGIVFEFDTNGLIINDHSKWNDCIALQIIPMSWNDHWDETLALMLKSPKWNSSKYNWITLNCFDFVIEFLNNLKYTDTEFMNKDDFCAKLLLPKIEVAMKYNFIFKTLENNEYFLSSKEN